MPKITPGLTACRLTDRLRAAEGGSETIVTYSHTGLGADGDVFIASFTGDYLREFMRNWESQMNHYLRHGAAPRATDG